MTKSNALTRRHMLGQLLSTVPVIALGTACHTTRRSPALAAFTASEDAFLEELERACFLFSQECAHPVTGMVKDRDKATGATHLRASSIAATGFGLSAWCLAEERGWV